MSCGKKVMVDQGTNYYICGKKEVYSIYRVVGELKPFRKCFKCEQKEVKK